ncbi:pyridoxamine 5'-phosphate oxidase family protein [Phenylobacterium soli]|uniref:Pyridoxamine 5'-phosphate oxidase family protein n=1 Tax=Phenylobacterium soli TaxID=2170551 RepID=A0A328AGH3_9CAUL|nr:pyridoxamine 5'-phosphate oxidase family protein [Phenylobacterium soli]RAK53681.1 pyridoxamine 5'-phosphate oxidase family protein [Phenylobacterium soli]
MPEFTPTERSRVRRRPQRAAYDEATVYKVLDAGILAHVGYVLDGQPFVTPTAYWRKGRRLYWHGAAASRMLRAVGEGQPVCLTVSFLDGFVLARSGFRHSLNYRSVLAFGRARLVEDLEAKRLAMDDFIERLYPGRTTSLRPATEAELKQIALAEMTIEEASAKQRAGGPIDYAPDEGWPAWWGEIPLDQRLGAPKPAGLAAGAAPRVALEAEAPCAFPF